MGPIEVSMCVTVQYSMYVCMYAWMYDLNSIKRGNMSGCGLLPNAGNVTQIRQPTCSRIEFERHCRDYCCNLWAPNKPSRFGLSLPPSW
ncbi:hypothetical protein BDV37DRAFT_251054 [Aspergillus pseudonomiae]|uniref:Uncharacterized protein n=1 Tax=Aspergillus pseudonomiae TaxID=1506151 RepID=A0A5N7D9L0_9EURO|nr:uncharacterized protein BDV37DRAFT_251054 [Aspergillus pseudonomiae]KAE8403071.1 hypothetical protein BDV37DRAFT_251054 [Aspergillus pseudonomiae]